MTAESADLERESERLLRERSALAGRLEHAEREAATLEGLAAYCRRVRERLVRLDHAGRRLALEAVGVRVIVDRGEYWVEGLILIDSEGIALRQSWTLERKSPAVIAVTLPPVDATRPPGRVARGADPRTDLPAPWSESVRR